MSSATLERSVLSRLAGVEQSVLGKRLRRLGLSVTDLLDEDRNDAERDLACIRRLMPSRSLGTQEAIHVAEQQALLLRNVLGVQAPRLDDQVIDGIDWVAIERRDEFPAGGVATETEFGWVIVVNSSDSPTRQRFSACHELKHVIDAEQIKSLGVNGLELYPEEVGVDSPERAERICDRFAAALLMPAPILRADWRDGLRCTATLARRYGVSRKAMHIRLSELGLIPSRPRCGQLKNFNSSPASEGAPT